MKAISFVTALLVSFGAFAADQNPGQEQTPSPVSGKQIIFCDYVEGNEFQLFMDIYVKFDSEKSAYSEAEFGVFQGSEQIGYPDYLWNSTHTVTENVHHIKLMKDQSNMLEFNLTGTMDGITLEKDEKGAIVDFELAVTGVVNGDKAIEASFICYDAGIARARRH